MKQAILKIFAAQQNQLGIKKLNNLDISPLGNGEHNNCLLVKVNQKKFVFRYCLKKKFEKNAAREFKLLSQVPLGFGPRPYYFDSSKTKVPYVFSILSYVEGEKRLRWSEEQWILHIKKLAGLHKRRYSYHRNTKNQRKKHFSLHSWFKREIKGFKEQLKDDELLQFLQKIEGRVKENDHLFTSLKKFSRIHGDLYTDNILFSKSIQYIDWEWSEIGDPAYDLATIFCKTNYVSPWLTKVSEKKLEKYLQIYLKLRPDKTLKKRVLIWNDVQRFLDLLYFKRKVGDYGVEELSKSHYQKTVQLLINDLKKL